MKLENFLDLQTYTQNSREKQPALYCIVQSVV